MSELFFTVAAIVTLFYLSWFLFTNKKRRWVNKGDRPKRSKYKEMRY